MSRTTMRIAFYAPLKPPTHPNPSGDRQMARMFVQALEQAGHEVELASRLRSREAEGDGRRQARLQALGAKLADRLIRRYKKLPARRRPQLWFTYHLYYKAPDWIGPKVAKALKIPYVVAEASVAYKRADGPWAAGHKAVLAALEQAAAVITLNPLDAKLIPDPAKVHLLKPFIDTAPFEAVRPLREDYRAVLASEQHLDPEQPWLLAAAMMRPGDKLKSYQILAQALRAIPDVPWQLVVAGEGQAYDAVVQAFTWAMPARVRFLGLVQPEVMPALYAACDLLVWPAVNEAFGMALLEAQAAGIPVVAGRSPGVENVVAEGVTGYLADPGLATFAASVREMLSQKASRIAMGKAAPKVIAEQHSLSAAARRLNTILAEASNP
ncbi:glycosyltransferase family 4 protein [Pelagibius sp. CAU 1746]|uniref:glycosyltransferase family 4 protein n=1 Tax=Pelagibius sp. CAU 1746 TaxID=3140370 RepID=UPI00325BC998